jgi:4-amino-4-deoxy-L-arabinose transferase-like glycosyltransferase
MVADSKWKGRADTTARHRISTDLLIIGILSFSLLSKLSLALWVRVHNPSAAVTPDTPGYSAIALNLLHHGVFSRSAGSPFAFEAKRPPGFPAVLAVIYGIFGTSPFWVAAVQAVLATLTVLLTYQIGKMMFGRTVGLIAAAALCLDPVSVGMSQVVLSETTYVLLTLLGVWFVVTGAKRSSHLWQFGLAGLALALATLVRPIGYYLPIGIAILLVIHVSLDRRVLRDRGDRCRKAVLGAVAVMVAPLLLVGGWQVFKYSQTGQAQLSAVEGWNMYSYRAAKVLSLAQHRPYEELHREMVDSLNAAGDLNAAGPRFSREGLRILLLHPRETAVMTVQSMGMFFLAPGSTAIAKLFASRDYPGTSLPSEMRQPPTRPEMSRATGSSRWIEMGVKLFAFAYLFWLYAGVVAGLGLARRAEWNLGVLLVVCCIVYFWFLSSGAEVESRFRAPISPMLCLLAAWGWTRMRALRSRRTTETSRMERS